MTIEPDRLWDAWRLARRARPGLALAEFAASPQLDFHAVREALAPLLSLERNTPPPPLVELALPGAGRFAGFHLLHGLGQGSSGMVFLARDERPGADEIQVALKILNPLLSAAPERRDSILREAEIAASLSHEGIVRVLGSGIERGYAWIATEWVDGQGLSSKLTEPLSSLERERMTLDIGLQLARALAHAHEHGVVHRDLKPANVLVSKDGRVKVLDFGLARSDGTAFALSSTGEMVGTPMFMAPEQVVGRDVGPWSDVWALGLLLWELASGQPVDVPPSFDSLMRAISRGRLRPSARAVRRLPRGLGAVVSRCLELHPDDRYPSAEELAHDLQSLADKRPMKHGALSTSARASRRIQRHPVRFAAGAALIVGCTVLGWWAWRTWPVPVHFDTFPGDRVLWIDGENQGQVPRDLSLRPGKHTWRSSFGDESAVFSGEFEVQCGEPLQMFPVLKPGYGIPESPKLAYSAEERLTWVQVATPEPTLRLEIDGVRHPDPVGITSFRLPLGSHTIRMEKDGYVAYERTLDITDQELRFLSHEFDALDQPWRTVVISGPFDDVVRRGAPRISGLRLFYEEKPKDANILVYVNNAYFGPTVASVEGSIEFRVELPVELGALDLTVGCGITTTGEGSRTRVMLSPDGERWFPMTDYSNAHPDEGTILAPVDPGSEDRGEAKPSSRRLEEFVRAAQHARTLHVRSSAITPNAGGDGAAYACALRAHPLPIVTADKKLYWSPALRIRVRAP